MTDWSQYWDEKEGKGKYVHEDNHYGYHKDAMPYSNNPDGNSGGGGYPSYPRRGGHAGRNVAIVLMAVVGFFIIIGVAFNGYPKAEQPIEDVRVAKSFPPPIEDTEPEPQKPTKPEAKPLDDVSPQPEKQNNKNEEKYEVECPERWRGDSSVRCWSDGSKTIEPRERPAEPKTTPIPPVIEDEPKNSEPKSYDDYRCFTFELPEGWGGRMVYAEIPFRMCDNNGPNDRVGIAELNWLIDSLPEGDSIKLLNGKIIEG